MIISFHTSRLFLSLYKVDSSYPDAFMSMSHGEVLAICRSALRYSEQQKVKTILEAGEQPTKPQLDELRKLEVEVFIQLTNKEHPWEESSGFGALKDCLYQSLWLEGDLIGWINAFLSVYTSVLD